MAPRKKPASGVEKVVPKKTESKPKAKKFVGVHTAMWHPFARVHIPVGSPGVILEVDSWLKSQLDRGLIKEL